MYVRDPQAEKWAFRFTDNADSKGGHKVETCTIPDILRDLDVEMVDILKIDIEGGEKDLFSQHTQWLSSIRHIFIEVHRGCWKTVTAALAPYEFDCKISREYLVVELQSTA